LRLLVLVLVNAQSGQGQPFLMAKLKWWQHGRVMRPELPPLLIKPCIAPNVLGDFGVAVVVE